jgi:hypothetical protein
MPAQPRGTCTFCGYETTKGTMARHIATCPQRAAQLASAEQSKRKAETLHYLRAQDARDGRFWLDLEVRGSAKLSDIDSYLRAIWLECCGHLSEFSVGYGQEIAMSRKVDAVFGPSTELLHVYDFGTSSETKVKALATRQGAPLTAKPMVLLARNLAPEAACIECGQAATFFCMECMIEDDSPGTLCAAHAEEHPHDDYGEPMELVNSPRLGMCGYSGPADPPY